MPRNRQTRVRRCKPIKRKCRNTRECWYDSCRDRRGRTIEGVFPRQSDSVRVAAAGMRRLSSMGVTSEAESQ